MTRILRLGAVLGFVVAIVLIGRVVQGQEAQRPDTTAALLTEVRALRAAIDINQQLDELDRVLRKP